MNKLQKIRPSDVRAKISQSLKNRTLSQSTKDKISASMTRRWAELNQPNTDQNKPTDISDIVL